MKQDERKVLGILAIVFGGIALALSWVPIINNVAFFFGIIALILGLIALLINRKNKKILSIIGTVLAVASIGIVLITQSAYSHAWNKATETVTKETKDSTPKKDTKTYNVGDTVTYDGVEYKVNKVDMNDGDEYQKPSDGQKYVVVNLTITNKSKSKIDYNPTYFAIDENGKQPDSTIVGPSSVDKMNSGSLESGASITGNLIGEAKPDSKLQLVYNGLTKDTDDAFKINLN
ncbi:DUF4352 domain-containing protein [Convivina praedatoris]|uniref:DUF4352 domain-containing protein n=1 Tax=Convivina praedatoris TaxID=2880963 RepID=UPI00201025CD|nr:DUF4352 domain-containing protein [Convivina sp. LMG 32447]CAH1855741.1 hypothetical protein R078138_01201 [Convivina sp. LMG 32447]